MTEETIYQERVSSKRTTTLFAALMIVFLGLFSWRFTTLGGGWLTTVFFCLFAMFLFYTLNYRALVIRITQRAVHLRFGCFNWQVPLDNIEGCHADRTSLWRIGGAGIHFTFIGSKYRAMFNFLEHGRVVLSLARRKGPVREIAFSTHQPEMVLRIIENAQDGKPDFSTKE